MFTKKCMVNLSLTIFVTLYLVVLQPVKGSQDTRYGMNQKLWADSPREESKLMEEKREAYPSDDFLLMRPLRSPKYPANLLMRSSRGIPSNLLMRSFKRQISEPLLLRSFRSPSELLMRSSRSLSPAIPSDLLMRSFKKRDSKYPSDLLMRSF
ncbi:unnamed protein product [Lepeophtheirus salmonis]|uniref:(salmon louse) hypothetical protein n=2 Tax=Lepeophtheirus salmonis TaxID=72036 RepID=A0A7R8CTD4_LEPSM|nr:uncharacterized protein LOC121115861 [Lepeophtheirus salmonis]CAB4063575.1 unnamed protein product [Lepeophtheirus salmonis]CAF2925739.1 unnamed protein product [Lepeophtheirus salmonis]